MNSSPNNRPNCKKDHIRTRIPTDPNSNAKTSWYKNMAPMYNSNTTDLSMSGEQVQQQVGNETEHNDGAKGQYQVAGDRITADFSDQFTKIFHTQIGKRFGAKVLFFHRIVKRVALDWLITCRTYHLLHLCCSNGGLTFFSSSH